MNRGRNNSRRGNSRNVESQIQMLKSSLHGHENKLRANNPPPFNRKPFNTIVVEELLSGTASPVTLKDSISPLSVNYVAPVSTGTGTVSSITKALAEQLDISTCASSLIVKIHRIDLWSISTGNIVPTIRGKFYSLATQISGQTAPEVRVNPIKLLEDIGVPGESAGLVSYSYPRDQSDIPLSSTSHLDPLIFDWKSDNSGLVVFARYHLHWNTGNLQISPPPPPPSVDGEEEQANKIACF